MIVVIPLRKLQTLQIFWSPIRRGLILPLKYLLTNADEVYIGCLNIWKSTDGGDSFGQLNEWFSNTAAYTHADIHTLKFFNNKLYCGSDGGIYVSEDGGDHFSGLHNQWYCRWDNFIVFP